MGGVGCGRVGWDYDLGWVGMGLRAGFGGVGWRGAEWVSGPGWVGSRGGGTVICQRRMWGGYKLGGGVRWGGMGRRGGCTPAWLLAEGSEGGICVFVVVGVLYEFCWV